MEKKEEYDKYANKQGLPLFDALKSEFDIHFEDDLGPLRSVLKTVSLRLHFYLKVLEELLEPEGTTTSMQETRLMTEDDRKELLALYAKMMTIDRMMLESDIKRDESSDIETLNSVWNEWSSMKQHMLSIASKMRDSWKMQMKDESYMEYFG